MMRVRHAGRARRLRTGAILSLVVLASTASAGTLDIYDIDAEGGAAVLFVSPTGQSVLIDTGNAGSRDALRIADAAKVAGVTQIDYLIITHYHGDHVGGFLELAKLLPIKHYVDHGATVQPEQRSDSKQAYDAATVRDHLIVAAGDKLPVAGIDWTIVSSAGKTLAMSLRAPAAGRSNPYCVDFVPKTITTDLENAQSVGSVIGFGKFRVIELGDLLWNLEAQLACPVNRVGHVGVLLTTHHGMNWSGVPAFIDALHPTVAVMNNGAQKGAAIETFQTLESAPGLQDLWQLHWSYNGLLEYNAPGRFIANIEEPAAVASYLTRQPRAATAAVAPQILGNPEHAPAYWIKLSAEANGDFTVTNSRNGFSKHYPYRD